MTDSVVLLDVGGTFVKGGIADSAGNLAEGQVWQVPVRSEAVSYTHLTLPTIRLV